MVVVRLVLGILVISSDCRNTCLFSRDAQCPLAHFRAHADHRCVARNLLQEGDKRRSLGGSEVPSGIQGQSSSGGLSEAPRSWRHMLNIRLNKATDRHKLHRTAQSPIILGKKFQLRRGTCTHAPLATPLIEYDLLQGHLHNGSYSGVPRGGLRFNLH